jgi:signal peptidase I
MESQEQPIDQVPLSNHSYKRLWFSLLSAIVPGLGDWLIGNRRRGLLFLGLFLLALLCLGPFQIQRFYWPYLLLAIAGVSINIVSGSLTLLSRRSCLGVAKAWILLIVPVAFLFAAMELGLATRYSGLRAFDVPSTSMAPTIDGGDKIMVDMRYYRHRKPAPGEVVVLCHHDIFLVKRIIGIGGDILSSKDGHLTVNGKPLLEPYAVHLDPNAPDQMNNFGPLQIAPDQLFVAGDNRDQSLDSRWRTGEDDFGQVVVSDVVGKPLYRYSSHLSSNHDGQQIQ